MSTDTPSVDNALLLVAPDALDQAVAMVADNRLPIEQRGALYAGLRRLRLTIDRALRPVTKEIELAMVAADAREWGPIRLTWKAIDARYPINDAGNWEDATAQSDLEEWWQQAAYRPFIRKVPAHYEVDTLELGSAVAKGDPGARDFYRVLNEKRYRTEEGRAPSLTVQDAA